MNAVKSAFDAPVTVSVNTAITAMQTAKTNTVGGNGVTFLAQLATAHRAPSDFVWWLSMFFTDGSTELMTHEIAVSGVNVLANEKTQKEENLSPPTDVVADTVAEAWPSIVEGNDQKS